MTSESAARKDIQKLQKAIVEGLEDVKGQDIVVFNTEELSPLFERVIIASGTSNRQTKALAASVRDAVREAGFDKPRVEGEDNGEWIIVDCGQAVAHVMQPVIRQYYRLEEIWGAKPVRLKAPAKATPGKTRGETAAEAAPAKAAARKAPAKKEPAKTAPAKTAPARKAPARKAPAKKQTAPAASGSRKTAEAKPAAKAARTAVRGAAKPAGPSAARPTAKKAPVQARARMAKVVVNAPVAKKKAGAQSAAAPGRKPASKKKA